MLSLCPNNNFSTTTNIMIKYPMGRISVWLLIVVLFGHGWNEQYLLKLCVQK
jgi:hypothetical protein